MPNMENRQWKYLIVSEEYEVRGTDDERVAKEAADDGSSVVIEVPTCKTMDVITMEEGRTELEGHGIEEQTWWKFD